MKKRLLFICSANHDRSPTAEMLFKDSEKYEVKSAGIFPFAVKQVNQEMIDWADIIFVMNEEEDKHLTFLKENFNLEGKEVDDLDIPDIYKREETKLIELLQNKLASYLK